jgi:hypothetical protein
MTKLQILSHIVHPQGAWLKYYVYGHVTTMDHWTPRVALTAADTPFSRWTISRGKLTQATVRRPTRSVDMLLDSNVDNGDDDSSNSIIVWLENTTIRLAE